MSHVLLEAIAAIGRVIRSIRTALAESQQHLIPAVLAVLLSGVSVSAQAPVAASDQRPASLEARVRLLEAELAAARQSLRPLAAVPPTAAERPAPTTTTPEPASRTPAPAPDGGAATGVRPTERAVLTRFQVAF